MNLVKKIFEQKGDDREDAYLTIVYAVASASTKGKRMELFNSLIDFLDREDEVVKSFNVGNVVCECGDPVAEEDSTLCDSCLEYKKSNP